MQTEAEKESGIEKAVRLAGNQSELARMLDITPQAVQKWVENGKPPPKRIKQIVGCFPGQITRAELDPDEYGDLPSQGAPDPNGRSTDKVAAS